MHSYLYHAHSFWANFAIIVSKPWRIIFMRSFLSIGLLNFLNGFLNLFLKVHFLVEPFVWRRLLRKMLFILKNDSFDWQYLKQKMLVIISKKFIFPRMSGREQMSDRQSAFAIIHLKTFDMFFGGNLRESISLATA